MFLSFCELLKTFDRRDNSGKVLMHQAWISIKVLKLMGKQWATNTMHFLRICNHFQKWHYVWLQNLLRYFAPARFHLHQKLLKYFPSTGWDILKQSLLVAEITPLSPLLPPYQCALNCPEALWIWSSHPDWFSNNVKHITRKWLWGLLTWPCHRKCW